MSDSSLIDRIVHGVLQQLAGGAAASPRAVSVESTSVAAPRTQLALSDKVITAELLEEQVQGQGTVVVSAKAIVTPAAIDYLKNHGVALQRGNVAGPTPATTSTPGGQPSTASPLLIVVHHTDAVARVWEDLKGHWRRELTACPDDAAKLAIAELSRGGAASVVILAEQTYRAACLANRSAQVKAVPIESVVDMKAAVKQIRVNTWCISPHGKSWFELRNLFKAMH